MILYCAMEVDDDLSTALGTETLADRDMVPPGFDNTPSSSTDALPVEIFDSAESLQQCKEAAQSREKCPSR